MWNLGEPDARFPAAAPNHPEALLARPQAFQAVRENWFLEDSSAWEAKRHMNTADGLLKMRIWSVAHGTGRIILILRHQTPCSEGAVKMRSL